MTADVVAISSADQPDPDGQGRAIVSTIGRDQPGLVSGISSLVTALNLSIDDSRMSILGGDFAVLMSVTGSMTALASLETELHDYCNARGMAYLFRRSGERQPISALPYIVTVTAMDHPGIVRDVAAFFSERSINILELTTETQPAPHTGTPMFSLKMTVEMPTTENMAQLKRTFQSFCIDQDLDGEMELES